jgi:hypothetical protein
MSAYARRAGATLVLRALVPFVLYSVARDVDGALGILLHSTLDLPDFVRRALSLLDPADLARHASISVAVGLVVWFLLALIRSGASAASFAEALTETAPSFVVLLLRPVLTVLALASLALQPTYPYAFTLPVALGQDLSIAVDALILAALLAAHLRRPRLPAPGALSIAFVAFVAYALLTPDSARRWEGHPGNEPKTLRMAVALGHGLSLDVEGVSAGMEVLETRPVRAAAADALRGLARESVRMTAALAHGPHAVGASAIRATRVTRQTIRGKDGGVFHVLAPGPSLLLAPALRLDRALNLARGTPGRLAVTVLFWNALAAALVAAVFLLARDGGAGPGAAAAVAGLTALLPPSLFYAYQFYPEMLGALFLAVALRAILLRLPESTRGILALGLLLAFLPWLHQKFLPVWGLLTLMAVVRLVDALVTTRALMAMVVPQVVSLYLIALYNFAITGSVRPDAVYLAWGPAGVNSSRWGQGLFGLALDARYGLLPYVPLFLFALGGLVLPGAAARLLRRGAVPMFVYYLTVAAADNWSGAVCNLGRYIMPVLPYAAALIALALVAVEGKRGVHAVFLVFTAWSALIAAALWNDPHAANDCALLLAKSAIADGNAYIPNLFIRAWADGAPGLWARLLVWTVLAAALAAWVRRAARNRGGARVATAAFGLAATMLVAAALLERWPTGRTSARFPDAIAVGEGAAAFVEDARVDGERAWIDPGGHEILVRTREGGGTLRLRAEGAGVLRVAGQTPLPIPPGGLEMDLPVEPIIRLQGRRGTTETLWRQRLEVEAPEAIVLRLRAPEPAVR